MIIQNFEALAKTPLRRDALEIIEAGFAAVEVKSLIERNLRVDNGHFSLAGQTHAFSDYEHIFVIGVGKGAAHAVEALEEQIGAERITEGHALDVIAGNYRKVKSHVGTHPFPSDNNVAITEEIVATLKKAGPNDLIISVIGGGSSSLLCKPAGLTSLELQFISKIMMMQGASIQELNTIRKHVSEIHSGFFAKYAYPATVVAMIISDVPGDDLGTIASGPTVMDTSTKEDAIAVARKYKMPEFDFIETPKDDKYFKKVTNTIIACGRNTTEAMAEKATQLGYRARVLDNKLEGIAREVGPALAAQAKPGQALLATGETRVIITHPGRGGRNQEVVLSAIEHLPPNSVIVSVNSDGKDNEPVAGAIADSQQTAETLKQSGLDIGSYLEQNNSYEFFNKMHEHILIESVTANISDFMLVLGDKSAH